MKPKIIILSLLLGAFHLGLTQDWELDETCEQAKERATKDFENGKMVLTSYGLIISEDYYFDEFYSNYLKENYQVEYGNGGCIVWDALLCYEDMMLELVEGKYGENFFDRTQNEARKEYTARRAEIIEQNHKENEAGYVWADTMPEYPGGFTELLDFVNSEMKNSGITETAYKDAGKFFIQFVVEPDGSLTGIKSVKSSNEEIEKAIINILQRTPKWKPGILNGETVKVQMVFPFYSK